MDADETELDKFLRAPTSTPEELVRYFLMAKDGDEVAFEVWRFKTEESVIGYFRRRGVKPGDREKLLEKVYASAQHSLPIFNSKIYHNPQAWLWTIVRRSLGRYWKKNKEDPAGPDYPDGRGD